MHVADVRPPLFAWQKREAGGHGDGADRGEQGREIEDESSYGFALLRLAIASARVSGEVGREGLHFEHCETRQKNKQAAASTLECQRCVVLNKSFLCTTFGLSTAAPLSRWVKPLRNQLSLGAVRSIMSGLNFVSVAYSYIFQSCSFDL